MTDLSCTPCPFGTPDSESEMTKEREDWAMGQMAREITEQQARSDEPSIPWDQAVAEVEGANDGTRTLAEDLPA
jgi:hypothetical protein